MSLRIAFHASLLFCCLLLATCGGNPTQPAAPAGAVAAASGGLPGLPDADALPRHTSATSYFQLDETAIYDSENFFIDDFAWGFSDELPGWVIFALDAQTQVPDRLDVLGYFGDLWVAVANYDTGRWEFLRGNAWSIPSGRGPLIQLAEGVTLPMGWTSPGGVLYVLFYSPEVEPGSGFAYGGMIDGIYLHAIDGDGDISPPTWSGGATGLMAIYDGDFGVDLTWDAATDDNAVDYYVLYGGPAALGIDWSSPVGWTTGELSFNFIAADEGYPYSFAVRAVDSSGNISAQTQPLEYSLPDSAEPDMLTGELFPGDLVQATWGDSNVNLGFSLIAPNYDEGSPQIPDFAGRSFIIGPDSLDSTLAEEWVRLTANPPAGVYTLEIQAHFDDEQTFDTLHVGIYDAAGNLRQNLGDFELGGVLGYAADVARLYVAWPEQ
jgi:hypothetical protein